MLPTHVDWPEIDGVPLCFLAQIDLAKLPKPIWSGVGPRDGHLVFFKHPNRCAASVLHVKGDLAPRSADVPMPDSLWTGAPAPSLPYFNKFPVTVIEHIGQMPEPVGWMPGRSSLVQHPFGGDNETLDLTSPLHQPFDEVSLDLLIAFLSDAIDMRLRQCAIQLEKDPFEEARVKLLSIQNEANNTRQVFDEAAHDVKQGPFDLEKVTAFLDKVIALPLTHFDLKRGSDNKVVDLDLTDMALVDPQKSKWVGQYLSAHDVRLFARFVHDSNALPARLRDRIAQICEFRAAHESGGMSHSPHSFIYTPHGRSSQNEVLLELPSSHLNGWMWGDVRSLVFLIDREALKLGRFDEIKVDITN